MFTDFYGLRGDPFRLSPDHGFCLRHPSFAKARAYMQFALHRAEGFVMITGRPGTGKSTLIEDMLEELEGTQIVSAKLVSAQLEADDLLRMVAFNFGVPAQGRDKSDLLLEMQGFLADRIADGQRPLLIIDEAQGLSFKALEELRLLTNLRLGGQPMLQIFLVGQDELRDLVLDKRLEQLHQRLIAACHLEPLTLAETTHYVMHRLKVAGWQGNPRLRPKLFYPLHRFCQGIPRRINLFMGRMLMHGWLEGKQELTPDDAEAVIQELRGEHLAPLPASDLFGPEQTLDAERIEDIIREHRQAADQKLGALLLDRRQAAQTVATPLTGPAVETTAMADSAPPEPSPVTRTWLGSPRFWKLTGTTLLVSGLLVTALFLAQPHVSLEWPPPWWPSITHWVRGFQ